MKNYTRTEEINRARMFAIISRIRNYRVKNEWFHIANSLGYTELERRILFLILKVESIARPKYFRFFEAATCILQIPFAMFTPFFLKNYTVGPLQIGIITSLNWANSSLTTANYYKQLFFLLTNKGSAITFIKGIRRFLNSNRLSYSEFYKELACFYNGKEYIGGNSIPYKKALRHAGYISPYIFKGGMKSSSFDNKGTDTSSFTSLNTWLKDLLHDGSLDALFQHRFDCIKKLVSEPEELSMVFIVCNSLRREIIGYSTYGLMSNPLPVIDEPRMIGSTAKVALYSIAIESNIVKPDHLYCDEPTIARTGNIISMPKNADSKHRGPVSLEYAFINSINTIAVQVTQKLGRKTFIKYLRKCGIDNPLPFSDLLGLGAFKINAWQLLATLTPIINDGYLSYIQPGSCRSTFPFNNGERILSPSTSNIMKRLLHLTTIEGTAKLLSKYQDIWLGGKTGTSEGNRDFWYIGIIDKDIYGLIWIGRADSKPVKGIHGYSPSASRFAVPFWYDLVGCILKRRT